MHWSVTLVLAAALGAGTPDQSQQFDSYSKAYWSANKLHRPMLVILHNGQGEQASLEALRQSETSREVLEDYVVAVVDTSTEHGRKVYDLFGQPTLPRTVVIDERQEKQIFRTSDTLRPETLTAVLQKYRDGTPSAVSTLRPATRSVQSGPVQGSLNYYQSGAGNCPNCRQFQ